MAGGSGGSSASANTFYLFTKKGARPMENQHQMRRFVLAALSVQDPSTVLQTLGSSETAG